MFPPCGYNLPMDWSSPALKHQNVSKCEILYDFMKFLHQYQPQITNGAHQN
jgi:hypothetical protein